MKKLLLSALLLLGFTTAAVAQNPAGNPTALVAVASTATATVNVDVIQPLTVTRTSDIDFGTIAANAGNVTLGAGGTVTTSGGGTASGTGTLGQFSITGASGYKVTVAGAVTTPIGGGISFTPAFIGITNNELTLTGGSGTVSVGGQLTVPSTTSAGAYQGVYTLTVAYASL